MSMGNVNIRITFEITKADKLNPQTAAQIRQLELQLAALKESSLAHSTVLTYNGMDPMQTLQMEKVAIGALDALNKMGEAFLAAGKPTTSG
jgi:spermidine/putrescine-binding protein